MTFSTPEMRSKETGEMFIRLAGNVVKEIIKTGTGEKVAVGPGGTYPGY